MPQAESRVPFPDHSPENALVEPLTLGGYLAQEPGDPKQILRIFRSILECLGSIHDFGETHQPLSPETIYFVDGKPCIHRASRAKNSGETVVFHNPKYSAPEAFVESDTAPACSIADSYILGFIFYELLLGQTLFEREFASLTDRSPAAWFKWHADRKLRPRPLSELLPNLPPVISGLIEKMLDKDPTKRLTDFGKAIALFGDSFEETKHGRLKASPIPPPGQLASQNTPAKPVPQLAAFAGWGALIVFLAALAMLWIHLERRTDSVSAPAPVVKVSTQPKPPIPTPPNPAPPSSEEHPAQLQVHSEFSGQSLSLDNRQRIPLSSGVEVEQPLHSGTHQLAVFDAQNVQVFNVTFSSGKSASGVRPYAADGVRYLFAVSSADHAEVYSSPGVTLNTEDGTAAMIGVQGLNLPTTQRPEVDFGDGRVHTLHFSNAPTATFSLLLVQSAESIPVRVTANVSNAQILVDGVPISRRLVQRKAVLELKPGIHQITVSNPKYQTPSAQEVVATVDQSSPVELKFELTPLKKQPMIGNSAPRSQDAGSGAGAKTAANTTQLASVTFRIKQPAAQIVCKREDDSQAVPCASNQNLNLRPGAYAITVSLDKFQAATFRISLQPGESKSYDWELDPIADPVAKETSRASGVGVESFENALKWVPVKDGWWESPEGYSFLNTATGSHIFEIRKRPTPFGSKKLSFVVDYKGDNSRVVYTLDGRNLRRHVDNVGIQMSDIVVPHGMDNGPSWVLKIRLDPDKVIIQDKSDKTIDTVSRVQSSSGKFGFVGKVILRDLR